jgi:phosphoglycolate phosphatase-like HAD superfamily hydrolase
MLVLFDIDGTLLTSLKAGLRGMQMAFLELHGVDVDFSDVEIAGRLDTLIWRDMTRKYGLPADAGAHEQFRDTYTRCLAQVFKERNTAEALPGTHALVDAVRATPNVTIGLLTGNYEATGMLKVRHAGFDHAGFVVNAWGDDGPDRRSLVPVAMERYRSRHGTSVAAQRVVILGDTPHDVDCAKAHGARVLAVATGQFTVDQLRQAGADHVAANLSDTAELCKWIVNP